MNDLERVAALADHAVKAAVVVVKAAELGAALSAAGMLREVAELDQLIAARVQMDEATARRLMEHAGL